MLRIRQNFREAASRKQRWMTYRKAVIFRLLLSLPLSIKENSELSSIKALWASARSLSSTVRETGLRRYHDKPWRGAFVCGKPEAGTVNLPSRKQWRMSPFLCL